MEEDIAPSANDDSLTVSETEAGGDVDGNVLLNDTNPDGAPLPVARVNGSTADVGTVVSGSGGGTFIINADGTFDFDAAGDFSSLNDGESATTSVTYSIVFEGAGNTVDVVFLQDLSGSFGDDLPNVRSQFSSLYDTLNTGRDVAFGVTSHVDKPISPFGSSGDYVYRTELAVTDDKAAIQAALDGLVLRFGGDLPESQFEALLQLALRADGEVGFREASQRIVVLPTDAPPHLSGAYASAGPNNGDAVLDIEDYPSVLQVRLALEAANITPIFLVTSNVLSVYQDLVSELGRGQVVLLTSNSSNLAAAVIDTLDTITTVETATLTVTVEGEGMPDGPICPVVDRAGTQNGTNPGNEVLSGPDYFNSYYFGIAESTGDDIIQDFQKVDVIVTDALLSDSNGDGIIQFSTNGVLKLDGTSSGDTVAMAGVSALRYLGEACEDNHVYADASVRLAGWTEGTLASDALSGDMDNAIAETFFFDTALDIDLGDDIITNFGTDDLLVLTTALRDNNGDGIIDFGSNDILDLPGGIGGPGGVKPAGENGTIQMFDTNGGEILALSFAGTTVVNGVTYYTYTRLDDAFV